MDTILMSKEELLEVAWACDFSDSVEFYEGEVEMWLV